MSQTLIADIADALMPIPGDETNQGLYYLAAYRWLTAVGSPYVVIDEGSDRFENCKMISATLAEHIQNVRDLIQHARAIGLVSKAEDPYTEVARLARAVNHRQFSKIIITDVSTSARILNEASDMARLVALELAGELELDRDVGSTSQLSSIEFFYGGYASDEAKQLLLQNFIDVDAATAAAAEQELAALDFSRRRPQVLFTIEGPDESRPNCVLCWAAMPDATSFEVTRLDNIDGSSTSFKVSSADVVVAGTEIENHVRDTALTFYPQLSIDKVRAYHDRGIARNRLYSYSVIAYQKLRPGNAQLFNVPTTVVTLSTSALADIERLMMKEQGTSKVTGSPYPSLSLKLYGKRSYDWLIAACTLQAAVGRDDDYSHLKQISYVGSDLDALAAVAAAGHLLVPTDPQGLIDSIGQSVGNYGVSQTIKHCFESAGVLLVDSSESDSDSSFLIGLLSAIDPVTATVKLADLYAAATSPVTGGQLIDTDEVIADSLLQDAVEFPDPDQVLDMTTVDGIGTAISLIRTALDKVPRRG